jgi:hypothetical protein
MIETAFTPSATESIRDCQAMMVCLEGRRFVIVRPDEGCDLQFVDGDKSDLRELSPGDAVIYRGRESKVRAIDVYC